MTLQYRSSNGPRAMRVARKMVKPLDWCDIESVVTGSMHQAEFDALFMAVDSDYLSGEQRLHEMYDTLEAALTDESLRKILVECSDLHLSQENTKMMAWFQLGYASALRLLDRQPEMAVVDGGLKEPRLSHGVRP